MRALAATIVCISAAAAAAPPVPSGPHPRIILNDVRAAWRQQAGEEHGPVKGAIALCDEAKSTREHDRALYQGAEWAKTLQACLVAWAATDSQDHAATAIKFMTALLDDLDQLGDGKGGDDAAHRDDGYAIRNLAPYTALAYDWLYDKLTPQQRDHAKQRFKAWLDWYAQKGYRHDTAGSNYHMGYVLAATLVAIATDDAQLWSTVADTMWNKQLIPAINDGGVLDGGDWPEGWQYGPLSVAELSLGARAMRGAGLEIPNISKWLGSLLRVYIYGLSPSDREFPGEDTEGDKPNVDPSVLVFDAVALGDASPDDKRWARGELSRLKLADRDYLLYDALAGVGDRPQLAPREKWPTWYLSPGDGTLFARTRWDGSAMWFVAKCHSTIDTDHRHPDAGDFVLSRGADDVIVDPSPYGTRSTLTGNAPTVLSPHLPASYKPSQGYWSEKTGWDFATQRASGIVAARCDYADQYRFQERPTDIPFARRDFVLLPNADGTTGTLVVIDRAQASEMDLRFRTPGTLALAGTVATAQIGGTKLTIDGTGGVPAIAPPPADKDCYKDEDHKGACTAARFPVTDYRVQINGPAPQAMHVIDAGDAIKQAPLGDPQGAWSGVHVTGPRDAVVIWRAEAGASLSYSAPKSPATTHVIFDAPEQAGKASIAAHPDGDKCAVTVTAGGDVAALPVIVTLDASCNVKPDPESAGAPSIATRPARANEPRSARGGCCGAEAAPGSSAAMAVVVLAFATRRRRKR